MRIYTLTPLTRRAASQRRAVLSGFDVPWRLVKVLGIGAVPALLVALVLWPLLGAWSLTAFVGVETGVWWLVESRDTTGLKVKHWRGLLDRRQARIGALLVCGEPLVDSHGKRSRVVASAVRVPRPEPTLDDLFGPPQKQRRN